MDEPLLKVALFVVVTNGFRALGLLAGPRWGGLLLGLPCNSALTLYVYGSQRGVDTAVHAAGTGLFGLVAAVAFALVYNRVIGAGWPLTCAVAASVAGYFVVAWSLSGIQTGQHGWHVLLAVLTVVGAWLLLGRRRSAGVSKARASPGLKSSVRSWLWRTVVPALCPLAVMACEERLGADWAGLLITFPGMSLAVLVLTHLERGPAVSTRMAQALPLGNLSMIAFIAVFCAASPRYGLIWGTAGAFAVALAVLPAVAWVTHEPERPRALSATVPAALSVLASLTHRLKQPCAWNRLVSLAVSQGRRITRFLPRGGGPEWVGQETANARSQPRPCPSRGRASRARARAPHSPIRSDRMTRRRACRYQRFSPWLEALV
jgi:hypothetical protein